VVEDDMHLFEGALMGTTDDDDNVKLLDLVKISHGHSASSGIIGAATSGSGQDHDWFNKAQFRKLKRRAVDGEYDAESWGKAVNVFAADRFLTSKLKPNKESLVDLAWEKNPYSWTFLAFEYAIVFNAFKNRHLEGSHDCEDCISATTVAALWKDAKLPEGFKPAGGKERLSMTKTHDLLKTMKVTMFPNVVKEMNSAAESNPTEMEDLKGFAEMICGAGYEGCKWRWPKCGPCGIPGMKGLQDEFGYWTVAKTVGAWPKKGHGPKWTKKEVTELPAEEQHE